MEEIYHGEESNIERSYIQKRVTNRETLHSYMEKALHKKKLYKSGKGSDRPTPENAKSDLFQKKLLYNARANSTFNYF